LALFAVADITQPDPGIGLRTEKSAYRCPGDAQFASDLRLANPLGIEFLDEAFLVGYRWRASMRLSILAGLGDSGFHALEPHVNRLILAVDNNSATIAAVLIYGGKQWFLYLHLNAHN